MKPPLRKGLNRGGGGKKVPGKEGQRRGFYFTIEKRAT